MTEPVDRSKALGRCPDRHVNIVTMDNLDAPCTRAKKDKPPCGKPMVEWALNGSKA